MDPLLREFHNTNPLHSFEPLGQPLHLGPPAILPLNRHFQRGRQETCIQAVEYARLGSQVMFKILPGLFFLNESDPFHFREGPHHFFHRFKFRRFQPFFQISKDQELLAPSPEQPMEIPLQE